MDYLSQYFIERDGGLPDPNRQGEINVRCPFPHAHGYETRPSAHINVDKGVFHCKTCEAEGNLESGGLSELGFISKLHQISYMEAIEFRQGLHLTARLSDDKESWEEAKNALMSTRNAKLRECLHKRGIDDDAIKLFELGYKGSGICYPVWVHGVLLDIREYNPNPTPDFPAKMKSESGAGCYLFPFDIWRNDDRPTVLCAGENDALLGRIMGFNTVTGTGGEGRFPELFAPYFRNRKVYVCYDDDDAGRQGGHNAAFILKQYGADVYIVSLGLAGTKDDKDITDFFIKRGFTSSDFRARLDEAVPFSEEEETKVKNKRYPLVNLWNIVDGVHHNKHISSRVVLSGIYDQGMKVPVGVDWECGGYDPEDDVCASCPLHRRGTERGTWILKENLRDVLKLVEVNDQQQMKDLRSIIGFPGKCPRSRVTPMAWEPVFKVIFTPDVDTLNEGSGTRLVEMYGYTVGLNEELEDGHKYRAFFKTFAHPKDQRIFMVIDKLEESDNSVNSFKMTPEIDQQLQIFKGDPFERMEDRAKRMHALTVYFKPPKLIADAYNISFHSVLEFNFLGRLMKGYPEIAIIGESRIGKTETGKTFQNYIRLGNTTNVKNASIAGLLGGADSIPSGGWRVNWGSIPRNHRGMLILDEFSGLSRDVIAKLTDMRSEGIATVEKIAKGKAPAKTRLVWAGNPKTIGNISKKITDYANGVDLVLDLIGADEDIARFDVCMILAAPTHRDRPNEKPELAMYDAEACRNLVCWAWSRSPDQVRFEAGVEDYIVHQAELLNDKFDSHIKFFGVEAWKKLARVAVACAAACYSCTDDCESVLVKKEHVDWTADFFTRCYDNPIFRLPEYAKKERSLNQTNERINVLVAGLCRTEVSASVIKTLLEANTHVAPSNLQIMSGMERQKFSELVAKLSRASLIQFDASKGIIATTRLRLAVETYRQTEADLDLVTLDEEEIM